MGLPVLALSEPSSCGDLRLAREITLLSAQMNIANFRLLKLINEFDIRGGWRSGGAMRSCAHWLAANCGMAIGAAREKVRVARRLAKLPNVEKAFASGDLSYSKVRAITRVATDSNENFLVTMAEQVSASHLEKLVGKYQPVDEFGLPAELGGEGGLDGPGEQLAGGGLAAGESAAGSGMGGDEGMDAQQADSGALAAGGSAADCVDSSRAGNEDMAFDAGASRPEGGAGAVAGEAMGGSAGLADEEQRREHARELFWFQDKNGMWVIHCKLPPEQGQLVIKTLEAVARPLQEERQEAWNEKQKAHMQAVTQHILRRHREAGGGGAGVGAAGAGVGAAGAGVGAAGAGVGAAGAGAADASDTDGNNSLNRGAPTDGSTPVDRSTTVGGDALIGEAPLPGAEETELTVGEYDPTQEKISAESFLENRKAMPASVECERAQEKISAESFSEDGKAVSASVECERAQEKISAESFSQFMNHVRADAFSSIAEHFLATSGNYEQLQNLKGAERCQVVLHVDINTLRGQGSGSCCTHSRAHFEDKPWLSAHTARRLSCDASLVTVLEDDSGKVLNVGRRSRVVPPNIRRALLERDGVCQYAGCHESRYVDAHHIKHWADGGETSLDNLITLCRFHHRELHRGNFEL